MINTQVDKFVPQIYRESRDFQVLLKLIDTLYSVFKNDIDSWIKLYSPLECPSDFLQFLSDFVGYQYDTGLSISESRVIINNFVKVLQNRGSLIGIREAAIILLNAQLARDPHNEIYQQALNQLSLLEIYFDEETGTISLYFPNEIKYNANFFNYVRPLGSYIDIKLSDMPEPISEILLEDYISTEAFDVTINNATHELIGVENNDSVRDLNAFRVPVNVSVGDTTIDLDFMYSVYHIRPTIIGSSLTINYVTGDIDETYVASYNSEQNVYEIDIPIDVGHLETTATLHVSTEDTDNNRLEFQSAVESASIYISYNALNTASRTSLSQFLQNEPNINNGSEQ